MPLPETPQADASPAPRLSVVIVNYDSWPDIHRLVSTLSDCPSVRDGRAEVLVIDNDSPGEPPEELNATPRGIRLIRREENGGFAVGVNAGWRASRAPWLLVLNPDVVPGPGFLPQVLDRVGRYAGRPQGEPGLVGFGLCNPDGSPQPSVGPFPTLFRTAWEQLIPRSRRKYQADWTIRRTGVAWVTGACVLINARMLDDVGGMDEDFFLYYEEVALCRSARDRGWSIEYDPDVSVVHLRPLQNRAISPKMRVVTRHSKLLYFRKHLPRWQFLTLCGIVGWEAAIRGAWSKRLGRREEAESWTAVAGVTRRLRDGEALVNREVRLLAESIGREPLPVQAESASRTPPRVPVGSRTRSQEQRL